MDTTSWTFLRMYCVNVPGVYWIDGDGLDRFLQLEIVRVLLGVEAGHDHPSYIHPHICYQIYHSFTLFYTLLFLEKR